MQQYGTYHHVMIIVLDDKLFNEDHVLLCDSTYKHVMIMVLDNKLCTADHVLLCDCTVLTSMS